jgi:conjugal transfer ATP-binding protein TraC
MNNNALVNKFEAWGFEEGITIFKDGSLGFAFEFRPLDINCAADDQINIVQAKINGFLSSLPSGIEVQFLQSIEKSGKDSLAEHLAYSDSASPIVRKVAEARFQKFSALDDCGALPDQRNFLLVRTSIFGGSLLRNGLLEFSFAKVEAESVAVFERSIQQTKAMAADIQRNFSAAGFQVERVDVAKMVDLVFDTWNPNHPLGLGTFDESDIRDKVLLSELSKEVRGFQLGSVHHRVVSLKVLPEETYAGMAAAITDLPFSSRLFVSVQVPDQNKEIEWLKLNRRMAYAMVVGKKGVSDLDTEAKLQDIEELLNDVVKNGEKIFTFSMTVVLRSTDEDELDAQVSHVLQVLREVGGAEGFAETYAAFEIFASVGFPNARSRERTKKIKSSNLADLLPLFGSWNGVNKPSVLLRNRMGGLFKFDPFADFSNANQIISGGSGAGKSHLTNIMIGQMLSQNPKVFILDVGGSYQKTCELLDGQYIPLSMASGIRINPFDRPEGTSVTDEKIKFLVALVQIMTKEEDQKSIGKLEKAEIERCIQKVYRDVEKPRMTHLRELLLDSELIEVQRIGKILSLWTGDSPFGRFLDQETSILLSSRVVCFDLKGLESNPDLQSAVLFTIMDLVWREVQVDRTEMKFLIFDECWRLLESEAGSQFVGEVFRTFRKYYASAVAISQNIDDFAKSKAAAAIMPCSSIKWILKQPGADFARLAEVLRLNDRELNLIQSLTQVKGQYSEAFLICEDKRSVVSVESTPIEYWLATTDPKDYILMKEEASKTGKSGVSLMEHMAIHFPIGASRAS